LTALVLLYAVLMSINGYLTYSAGLSC